MVFFDAHVGARENCGGETYEGGERDQEDVEGIDEELLVADQERSVANNPWTGESGEQAWRG